MRQLLGVVALCCGISVFVACSMETDEEASATIPYVGYCDSVVFEQEQDTVFEPYIKAVIATKTIPLVGDNSMFTESYTTKDGIYQNAVANCNYQAMKTYEVMLDNVTPRIMRSTMVTLYGDSVDFDSLDRYTIYYSLYGFVNTQDVKVGSLHMSY